MSFESGGGGYVAYNTAENDRDDAWIWILLLMRKIQAAIF